MFVPFLIMFREGLEAALIVSLIASYLKRTQRSQWLGIVWIGVILAAALCLGLGIFINETTGEFPQKQQELFEGIVAVVAVGILTYMVFWMRKVSRSVKTHLEGAIDNALNAGKGQGWALVAMVFFAVAREGLESVFFLLAAFQQDVGIQAPIGAVLGLVCAIIVGMMIYWGGVKLHLAKFFKWTSLFILFVAAGLAAGAIRAFHEAGLWNYLQDIAFNFTDVLSTHSLLGTLLEGIFGYQEAPTVSEVLVYFLYLIPALIFFFMPQRAVDEAANRNASQSR
ncbi:ferrous iron transport permease [Hafnia paralvei ATCC 29927]|jgi:high-affinity iron transporter|uniref:Iron permease n=1 Tax=Hafnia paralvei TaxID=546367 RepID=A0A2A2MEM1_9GAMM|nr:iron uptake transporter permease EfeU [Hafnia paralvei]MDU1194305.1 iron uptake transporter permease EfeU [Enterobacteriaceae bacterium]KHS47103.1 iron permease [Hafnia paralvei]MCE9881684.1 FTR1 family protein [Hafnia paralvei]MCE9909460.1 FTR1 family protein [Hafnia paralvei]MCE9911697.1 FTR1 family protein [Hafnia paralvei]